MQTNYISKGKELLKLLINNGFEGYFVGEAVRNSIMNTDFKRADIITNARIEDLRRINSFIFNDCATLLDNNVLKVVYQDYDFYFKSFSSISSDLNDNRTKLTKHYSSNLLDELYTKDFTIDAIAMSYSGKITDAYNGTVNGCSTWYHAYVNDCNVCSTRTSTSSPSCSSGSSSSSSSVCDSYTGTSKKSCQGFDADQCHEAGGSWASVTKKTCCNNCSKYDNHFIWDEAVPPCN